MRRKSAYPSVDREIARLAARQHGVVSRAQLRATGLGDGAVSYRLRVGRLHRIHRAVYAVGYPQLSERALFLAAALACGERAVVSHRSAATLWGVRPQAPRAVDVTIPGEAGRRQRRGLTIHRTRQLSDSEVTRRDGVPVTSPARTLLDLAEVLPCRPLERALDEAERLRLFKPRAIRAAIEANRGRVGAAALAKVLERHLPGSTMTCNDLEELFLALCDSHDLPRPAVNTPIGRFRPDFLWREQRLIVETDGRETHGTRAAFEADRARDAELTVAGYRVVRFTYRQVTNEPAVVARILRSLLDA